MSKASKDKENVEKEPTLKMSSHTLVYLLAFAVLAMVVGGLWIYQQNNIKKINQLEIVLKEVQGQDLNQPLTTLSQEMEQAQGERSVQGQQISKLEKLIQAQAQTIDDLSLRQQAALEQSEKQWSSIQKTQQSNTGVAPSFKEDWLNFRRQQLIETAKYYNDMQDYSRLTIVLNQMLKLAEDFKSQRTITATIESLSTFQKQRETWQGQINEIKNKITQLPWDEEAVSAPPVESENPKEESAKADEGWKGKWKAALGEVKSVVRIRRVQQDNFVSMLETQQKDLIREHLLLSIDQLNWQLSQLNQQAFITQVDNLQTRLRGLFNEESASVKNILEQLQTLKTEVQTTALPVLTLDLPSLSSQQG